MGRHRTCSPPLQIANSQNPVKGRANLVKLSQSRKSERHRFAQKQPRKPQHQTEEKACGMAKFSARAFQRPQGRALTSWAKRHAPRMIKAQADRAVHLAHLGELSAVLQGCCRAHDTHHRKNTCSLARSGVSAAVPLPGARHLSEGAGCACGLGLRRPRWQGQAGSGLYSWRVWLAPLRIRNNNRPKPQPLSTGSRSCACNVL